MWAVQQRDLDYARYFLDNKAFNGTAFGTAALQLSDSRSSIGSTAAQSTWILGVGEPLSLVL